MRRTSVVWLVLAGAVLGCGDDGPPDPEPRDVGIGVHATPTTVTSEAGGRVEITATLFSAPTAPVTIAISSDAPGEGLPSLRQLRFEAGDVGPHTFEVTGVDDAEVDGTRAYHVVFAPTVSDDPGYAGIAVPPLALTNTDDDSATATAAVEVEINPALSGDGDGQVTSQPAGISCPGTCTADFPIGSTVTLTATAAAGDRFGGWLAAPARSFAPSLEVRVSVSDRNRASAVFVVERFGWLRPVDGPAQERITELAANDTHVVVVGSIDGPTSVGGGPLPFGGGRDPLVAAYDASDGAHRWSVSVGGTGTAAARAVALLAGGDTIVGGAFEGELVLGGTVIPAVARRRAFVARLAARDGAIVWSSVPARGTTGEIAAVAASPDGGFVTCGSGAAPVARHDAAGAVVATAAPALLVSCDRLSRRPGGWLAAGAGGTGEVVIAWLDEDLAVVHEHSLRAGDASVLVDDVRSVRGDRALVAVTTQVIDALYRSTLLRVSPDGDVEASAEVGITPFFARAVAFVDDGAATDAFIVARRQDTNQVAIERWAAPPLARQVAYPFHASFVTDFALAARGTRLYLAASSFAAAPFPGWPLAIAPTGSLVGQLALPPVRP